MKTEILGVADLKWKDILAMTRHDIYHLPEYVALEAKRTNTIPKAFLAIEEDKIFFVPYLIRSCQDILGLNNKETEIFDVVSPYGYPGLLLNKAAKSDAIFPTLALQLLRESLQMQGICSGFFRLHPILNENFLSIFPPKTFWDNGTTVSINLENSLEQIWSDTKSEHRNKINRCVKKHNLTTKITKFSEGIDLLCKLYEETMARVAAKDVYYSFNKEYFTAMNAAMGDKLYFCIVESAGEPASVGLYTECCGIVQAAFGGTRDTFVKQSPSILEIDYTRRWFKEKGFKYLHLGGGVGSYEDGVYKFKAGFSRQRHQFLTLRLIVDEEKYNYLLKTRAKQLNVEEFKLLDTNFFPAYRANLKR